MSALAAATIRRTRLPLACAAVGFLVGLVALGGGLRLAMRVVALLNPDTFVFTANGNLVGEITLEGTLFILVAGAVAGILFGLAYGVVRSWLPWHGAPRGLVYGALLAAALGTPTLVDGDNLDFALLDGDALAVAMLLACPVLYGAGLGAVVDRLAPREPALLRRRGIRIAGTAVIAVAAGAGLVRLAGALAELAS